MKILLADSDRDFLLSYKKLFEYKSHKVTTAFDGTQAVVNITNEKFDFVIVNKNIPRVNYNQIVKMLNENNIPVIVLLDKKITSGMLLDSVLAESYLYFPFLPYELFERAKEIMSKREDDRKIKLQDLEIDIKNFQSIEGVRFTNEELNILISLFEEKKMEIRQIHSYINSINNKLERLNKDFRVKYVIDKGYRAVKINE